MWLLLLTVSEIYHFVMCSSWFLCCCFHFQKFFPHVSEHLACLQCGAVANSAARNNLVYVSLWGADPGEEWPD